MSGSDEPTAKRPRREVTPAMTFPYELDSFQKLSIDALEDGDSVLVSAHTSAGKTTVALYAIAKALREKRRVIYTSPIKALSNQKFREFSEKFDSVGLMTGDTTIKADSDCLVMTTEILRSMLYRGTEMLREVGCVIFDEVHYMRDKSRGVVWEETITLLPEGCQYVFLSATIPNAREFADWVESIHPGTKVHVIHTDYRPVPLQHYLYPCGADGIFLIVDEQGKFRDDNFRRAMSSMGAMDAEAGGANGADVSKAATSTRGKRKPPRKGTQPIMEIIKLAMDHNMYPIIVFSFSRAECERNALALSKLNFNNMEEDALVTEVFSNAMECLAEDDRQLPAIEHLLPLLKRGVGIHHSGLLPILKEVVEILFQAGLVKVLFSTETFSMGLNMPARTVVFTSVKKFDGEKNRYLTGGEYIQMSGRAGRRGLDRVGVVIAMVDEAVEPETLKQLTGGGADVLNSSFHLTYNMVLNLLRVEDVDPEFMMRRSFAQFQRLRNRPVLEKRAEALTEEIESIHVEHEEVFRQFTLCQELLANRRKQLADILKQPTFLKRFTHSGRLLRIRRAADDVLFNWGICRAFHAKVPNADPKSPSEFSVDVAVICLKANAAKPTSLLPCHVNDFTTSTADLYTLTFDFTDIESVARFRVNLPAEPDTESGRAQMVQTLSKLHRQYDEKVPLLTAEEMGVDDPQFEKLRVQVERLEAQLAENEFVQNPTKELESDFEHFTHRAKLEKELNDIREELNQASQAIFSEELKQMMRVLRRLDYIDKDNVILRKARVACEITTTDENEILLTELLFKGVLNSMETEMIVALMSCLVNVHRTPDGFSLPEEFQQPLKELNEIVSRIATVSIESGVLQEGGVGVERTMPSLMEVTYMWAKGAKFVDIMGKTSAYEGEIVRMMRRLEEQLRQMAGAARSPAIGSMELHDKFLKGIQLIKRDIVFVSSLYL
ncbi:RNA helicase, putative [Trypanosoma cruzi]|uniref:RNA helicase n=2 Tax=Trypanosoma cruzi TaxID=5693 RepID=V5BPT8_TRYCR|nr:RNA helicase, putative [Trypanosoma cruzi]ESS66548.1 RNA helicase [Trypanosoma cruzi Dm28c]PBJ77597.1 ATP-dependent RNA helicase [Trypanosoma cruzi cruzi]KAF8305733.1 ATP-dependent RNA helicase MTR4 [Trypanosoma cruzi]PWU89695.1 putative ATP-dependent RNA helicase [Trypanosoma cruzi]